MTLPSVQIDSSGQSAELVGWNYLEAVFVAAGDRSAQYGVCAGAEHGS